MIYQHNQPVSANALSDLRAAVGWNRMEKELQDPRLISYYHIAVYEESALIAYIDCVSNCVTDAYIQDLMVHPKHQGKGIGTRLMKQMIVHLKKQHIYMISVLFDEELRAFYEHFGFSAMLCGQMETYRCDG